MVIFTARNSSCGKVMFLQVPVIGGGVSASGSRGVLASWSGVLPLGAGGCTPPRQTLPPLDRHSPPRQTALSQADSPLGRHPHRKTPPRQTSPRRTYNRGKHPAGRPPPKTATEAGGTHPTGMHSCL